MSIRNSGAKCPSEKACLIELTGDSEKIDVDSSNATFECVASNSFNVSANWSVCSGGNRDGSDGQNCEMIETNSSGSAQISMESFFRVAYNEKMGRYPRKFASYYDFMRYLKCDAIISVENPVKNTKWMKSVSSVIYIETRVKCLPISTFLFNSYTKKVRKVN